MKTGKRIVIRIYAALLTAMTLLTACLVCREIVCLFREGHAAENLTETGARIGAVYSPETIAAHFGKIAWPVGLWAGFALAGIVFGLRGAARRMEPRTIEGARLSRTAGSEKRIAAARIALAVLAAALIVLGLCGGGAQAMFVKAVTICAECIGLG